MKPNKELFQYDINQSLSGCTGKYIDFIIGGDVYRVQVDNETCLIPDELLQVEGDHTVYQTYEDGTMSEHRLFVYSRPKPPNYIYTPTEKLTFDGLVQRVDDAVADMIRRADSGEFTPVKGKDYFTASEIQQIQNEVSSGAIGEFKTVVDTETDKFNANATEKVNAYNQNDSDKTTSYNANAESKVNEYNTNADNRIAEFDAHTEQIQTDINNIKSDVSANQSELDRTNSYLDALFKLNKGQTYDVLEQESEAYSVDVPSGSRYVGIDNVGGKSVVWNQLVNPLCFRATSTKMGLTFTNNGDGSITVNGTATSSGNIRLSAFYDSVHISVISGHKHYCKLPNAVERVVLSNDNNSISFYNENQILSTNVNGAVSYDLYFTSGVTYNYTFKPQIFDLTAMFGAGNEPSTVEEFEAMFPNDYYPYSEPTIISSQTDRVDIASADSSITRQITTGFPVLNSAGSVYDYIDLNEGKLHQRVGVVDMGALNWGKNGMCDSEHYQFYALINGKAYGILNLLCSRYENNPYTPDKPYIISGRTSTNGVSINEPDANSETEVKTLLNGMLLYYELAEEVITDITIPTELTDWLTVEAGGSVTFHNTDEGKRLLIPNKLSFVRKLDEVSV